MTQNPEISVILPVWNAEKTLAASLDSILAQSFEDFEVIAVDDGSSDGTPGLLAHYEKQDERIYVVRRQHGGIVAALCTAVQRSRGDLLARTDADDVVHPERLQRQQNYLAKEPEVGLVASRVAYEGDPEANRGFVHYVEWSNSLLTCNDMALNRFVESPLVHPSVMFRRACVDRWGGYREGPFPEDYELWLRWMAGGVRMEKLSDVLMAWTDSECRLTRTDPRYSDDAFYRVKALYLAEWLHTHNAHHPQTIVWGAGRISRQRAEMLTEHGVEITAYVDIDEDKIGHRIQGRKVLAPDELPPPADCFVVSYVGSRGARKVISAALQEKGFVCGRDFICAA